MASIIETMDQVEGRRQGQSVSVVNPKLKLPPVKERADEIFKSLDTDNDGEITQEEFVEGYLKMHHTVNGHQWSRQSSLVPTTNTIVPLKLNFKVTTSSPKPKH